MPVNKAPSFALPALNGQVLTDFHGAADFGYDAVVQGDGKLLVVGRTEPLGSSGSLFAAARYNADGSLDTTYGQQGLASASMGPGFNIPGGGVLQADGKLVIAGHAIAGGKESIALLRLLDDGTPDPSFGTGGKVVLTLPQGHAQVSAVTVQADGKLVVVGHVDPTGSGGNTDMLVARFLPDGSLDTGFGNQGLVIENLSGGFDHATDVVVQANGSIVVSAMSGSGPQADLNVLRYDAGGALDPTFAGDGSFTLAGFDVDAPNSLDLQSDGSIILAGYHQSSGGYQFTLWRLGSNGSLDTGFGSNGALVTAFGASDSFSNDVVVLADDRIVATGFGYFGGFGMDADFVTARYLADGTPDPSFGNGGQVVTGFTPEGSDVAYAVVELPGGRIAIAGTVYNMFGHSYDFGTVVLNADGSPDTTVEGPQPSTLERNIVHLRFAPVVLDTDVVVHDPELGALNGGLGDYGGASLTLKRAGAPDASDAFSAAAGSRLGALVEGGDLTLDGVVIGTVARNSDGILRLVFAAGATEVQLAEVMQAIAYDNDDPQRPPMVELRWLFDDGNTGAQGTGGAGQVTGAVFVSMLPSGDKDTIYGTPGPDTMDGYANADILVGAEGDDLYRVDDPLDYVGEGRLGGHDTVEIRAGARGNFTLAAWVEDGVVLDATGQNLAGNGWGNVLRGNDGDDFLDGRERGDWLVGGLGNDTLEGGSGIDTAEYRDAASGVSVDLGTGSASGAAGNDQLTGIENVGGSRDADQLAGDGGANALRGRGGDDLVEGGGADDGLYGGGGADTLEGGAGSDTLDGGRGFDLASYAAAGTGVAVDLAAGTATESGTADADALTDIEDVRGGSFGDLLRGDSGANRLDGAGGDDTLEGGAGRDLLAGGTGADLFVFVSMGDSPAGVPDKILDFSAADGDRIDLSAIDADSGTGGDQAFVYIGNAAFTAAGQLRFENGLLSGDVDGDGHADFAVKVAGVPSLRQEDLVL